MKGAAVAVGHTEKIHTRLLLSIQRNFQTISCSFQEHAFVDPDKKKANRQIVVLLNQPSNLMSHLSTIQ